MNITKRQLRNKIIIWLWQKDLSLWEFTVNQIMASHINTHERNADIPACSEGKNF
jgi:hypothetical protein